MTSRQHSSDMMQVLPAVWMMMMMRFILGQWVSLASHADHEIIVEQKEKGSKKKKKKGGYVGLLCLPMFTTEHPHPNLTLTVELKRAHLRGEYIFLIELYSRGKNHRAMGSNPKTKPRGQWGC